MDEETGAEYSSSMMCPGLRHVLDGLLSQPHPAVHVGPLGDNDAADILNSSLYDILFLNEIV